MHSFRSDLNYFEHNGLYRAVVRLDEALTRRKIEATLRPRVSALEAKIGKRFIQQGKDVARVVERLARLVEAEGDTFDSVFDSAALDTSSSMLEDLTTAVVQTFVTGGAHVIADLGIKLAFDLTNPRATAYSKAYGADQISGIDEESKAQIRRLVTEGVSVGESYDSIAKKIRQRYREFAAPAPQQHIRSRAHLVAITELGNAYQAGNLAGVKAITDTGIEMEKRWATVGDDRVSEGCQANEDQGWIDIDEPFDSGDDAPLRFPGCRCHLQYQRKRA